MKSRNFFSGLKKRTMWLFLLLFTSLTFITLFQFPQEKALAGEVEMEISPIDNALAKLLNLNGVNFYWEDKANGAGKQMGVIAQEVEAVLPELVRENKAGIKSVSYDGLFPVVVEAMKEQQGSLKNIEERIQALEKQ